MRILFLQDHLRIGGTEKQTLALAHYGQKNGYQTGILVFRPGGALPIREKSDFFYKTLQPFNTYIDEWAPGLIKNIKDFSPDAIVFMGKVSHLYLERLKSYFPNIAMIATFRSGKQPVPYYLRALSASHGILTNNKAEEQKLSQHNESSTDKIIMIHNGCLLPQTPLEKPRKESSTLRIIYVAMFRPQKNQAELVTILSKLPSFISWTCTLVGTGKTLNPCKHLVKSLGIEEKVQFRSTSDPHPLYQEHHIAVSTSVKEGLPNFLIEAQWTGLPVVAYLVNGVGECFEDSVSGFGIPPGDQQAFIDALQLLASSPERLNEMSKSAIAFSHKRFNFEDRSRDFFLAVKQVQSSVGTTGNH